MKLINTKQAAEILGVSRIWVAKLVKDNILKTYNSPIERGYKFNIDDIYHLKEQREMPGTSEVANILGITRSQVSKLVRDGQLKAHRYPTDKMTSPYRFFISEVYGFLKTRNEPVTHKICPRCNIDKPIDGFYKSKRSKDGHQSWCKECRKQSEREYFYKNKEKIYKRQNEWRRKNYAKNRTKILARRRNWYRDNRDRINTKQRERYDNDSKYRQSILKQMTNYRNNNREKVRLSIYTYRASKQGKKYEREYRSRGYVKEKTKKNNKRYYRKNTKRLKKQASNWRQANPDKRSFYQAKRRAQKKNQSIDGIPVCRNAIIMRDKAICYICNTGPLKNNEIHLDHLVPLSKGGLHTPDNIKVSCISCNCKKQDKSLDEVLQLIEMGEW